MNAPILIITLCRFNELKKCIASLQKNKFAKSTELYIGVDFPLRDSHKEGYEKILSYLEEGIKGFANVHIIKQTENKGWFQNFLTIRDLAYQKYDRFIYLEDDIEVAPNFLEYMNQNLTYFESSTDIQGICGYSYPFDWMEDGNNVVKINTYFTAWGYGTWKEKENEMYRCITMCNFKKYMRSIGKMRRLYKESHNQFCNFVKGMLEYIPVLVKDEEIVKLDMAFSIFIFMNDKYVIFPKNAKTRNIGYNGSGMNCEEILVDEKKPITAKNFDYGTQKIDLEEEYKLTVLRDFSFHKGNNQRLNCFYHVEPKERIRTIIAYLVFLILGREKTRDLLRKG